MKGDPRIVKLLNEQLAREYGAIIQYTVHSSLVKNWGYEKLASSMLARAKQEMGHADRLQDRITFLDSVPSLQQVPAFTGATIPEMMDLDLKGEMEAQRAYNEIVKLCIALGDNGTRQVADANLAEEEQHINDIESNLREISDLKIPLFLAENIE